MRLAYRLFPLLCATGFLFSFAPVRAQEAKPSPEVHTAPAEAPKPARALLDAAMKKAKSSKKRIFVLFDASW